MDVTKFQSLINNITQNSVQKCSITEDLTPEQWITFLDALNANKSLEELYFWFCLIDIPIAEKLADLLKANTTWKRLQLNSNQIGPLGVEKIADALIVNTTLTWLNINWNQISDVGTEKISNALKVNSTLTSLSIMGNQIGDAGAEKIADALKVNSTLTSLSIKRNQIDPTGIEKIADALKVNSTLINLFIDNNQISDIGVEKLADALKVNSILKNISIGNNQIGPAGAEKLADALKVNSTLINLLIMGNQIGDIGAEKIASAIKLNATLTDLNLCNNQITNIGANNLALALQFNVNLRKLDFDVNDQIALSYKKKIATQIELNNQIHEILASNEFLTIQVYNDLQKLISRKIQQKTSYSTNILTNHTVLKKLAHQFATKSFWKRNSIVTFPSLKEIALANVSEQAKNDEAAFAEAQNKLPTELYNLIQNDYSKTESNLAHSRLKFFGPEASINEDTMDITYDTTSRWRIRTN